MCKGSLGNTSFKETFHYRPPGSAVLSYMFIHSTIVKLLLILAVGECAVTYSIELSFKILVDFNYQTTPVYDLMQSGQNILKMCFTWLPAVNPHCLWSFNLTPIFSSDSLVLQPLGQQGILYEGCWIQISTACLHDLNLTFCMRWQTIKWIGWTKWFFFWFYFLQSFSVQTFSQICCFYLK